MKKTALVVIGVVVLVSLAYIANLVSKDAKVAELSPETSEFHSKNGYTITYPKNWTVDDSQKDAPTEFVREPSEKAFVAIQAGQDDRLKSSSLRDAALAEAETAFQQNRQYKVETFEWKPRDKETDTYSYMATGSYEENGLEWRFREVAVFNSSGKIFFFRGNVRAEFAKTQGPVVDQIIFSFRPSEITAESARIKIESLAEVVRYQKMLVSAGKKASFEVQDGDGEWSVHVFEIVKNGDGPSHTATFGWYRVDKKTGSVEKD